jgi:phosphohistidine phosphatase
LNTAALLLHSGPMRLLLFRHAKSARPPSVDDFDRPLCERGKYAAPLIGAWLREHGMRPELALCSPACRAKETLGLIVGFMNPRPEIQYDPALYLAETPVLLARIRAAAAVSPLMLVGHNPGLQDLGIALLARRQTGAAKKRMIELSRKFPTAGLAVLDFKCHDWKNLQSATGNLVDFVVPKSLMEIDGDA